MGPEVGIVIAVTPFLLFWGSMKVLTFIWREKPSEALPGASEAKTDRLLAWHDAFDAAYDLADPETSIFKALEAADKAVPPPLPPATLPNYKTKLGYKQYAIGKPVKPTPPKKASRHTTCPVCYSRTIQGYCTACAYQALPGAYGSDMGSISAHDGVVDLKDGGYAIRMTSEEWVRQGRPSAKQVIDKEIKSGCFMHVDPDRSYMVEPTPEEEAHPEIMSLLNQGLISPDKARERMAFAEEVVRELDDYRW